MTTAGHPEILSLTFIRALACLTVFLGHAGNYGLFYNLHGAEFLGVMLFFCLSGFLMVHLYGHCKTAREWKNYAIRRFLRIYPLYACAVLICGFMVTYTKVPFRKYPGGFDNLRHLLFMDASWIFWSIRVECAFYLVFPLIAILMAYLSKHTRPSIVIACLLCMAVFFHSLGNESSKGYFLITLWRSIECVLAGMAAGYAYTSFSLQSGRRCRWLALPAAILLLMAYIGSVPRVYFLVFGNIPPHYISVGVYEYGLGLSLLMSALVLCFAVADRHLRVLTHHRIFLFLGTLSYAVYLTHDIFLRLFAGIRAKHMDSALYVAAPALMTLGAAYALHYLIELPCIRWGKRLTSLPEQGPGRR